MEDPQVAAQVEHRPASSKLGRLRPALVVLLGLIGTVIFAKVADKVYPAQDWLLWRMIQLWGWTALFSAACASFGQVVLVRAMKLRHLPAVESAALSMAVGAVAFGLCMYAAGAVRLFRPAFAVALPALFLAIGALDGWRLVRRLRWASGRVRHTWLSGTAAAFGLLGVAIVYLGAMTPDSVNYDASWYHLRAAQDYARWGRLAPFWDYNAIVPNLASIFYTWGYLVPGLDQPGRWMMALHLEFGFFAWTLVAVTALVKRMVGDWRVHGAYAAFFLFPIIFVYDSSLGAAADHVLAFFSVPVVLATWLCCRGFRRGACALMAVTLGAAILTKYQSIYLVCPVSLLVLGHWGWGLWKTRRDSDVQHVRNSLRIAPVVVCAVGLAVILPHFGKNWVFYGNPVYPFLTKVFRSSAPAFPDGILGINYIFTDTNWVPKGSLAERAVHAVRLFFTFSFDPHYSFSNNIPSFGSLFTLLLPGVILLRRRKGYWLPLFIGSSAIFIWAVTFNVDRNLQTFMPILVASTGALIVGLWRLGWLARLGLIPLVGMQLVWGGDAFFYSNHPNVKASIDLIRSGADRRAKQRMDGYRWDYVAISKALPKDAKVVLHTSHLSLGIDRDVFQDWAGYQGLISYHTARTPRELHDYFKKLGMTHLLEASPARPASTRQEEVLFDTYVDRYASFVTSAGGFRLKAVASEPPPEEAPYQVLCLGLGGYADGLYPIETLTTVEHLPDRVKTYARPHTAATAENLDELLAQASAVLSNGSGDLLSRAQSKLTEEFDYIRRGPDVTVHRRRR